MLFEEACKSLEQLNEEEKLAFDYYNETGKLLTYSELHLLMNSENPHDFSKLKSGEFKKQFEKKYLNDVSKVVAEKDAIAAGKNLVIKKLSRYTVVGQHKHKFVEISCVLKGRCIHEINGKKVKLEKGSIVIIPPDVEHDIYVEPDAIHIAMGIESGKFDRAFKALTSKGTMLSAYFENSLYSASSDNTLIFRCGNNAFIPELLICIYKQNQLSLEKYNSVVDSAFRTFLMYLLQNFEDTVEFFDNESAAAKQMVLIERYIRQNYKTVTLESTAEHFFLSTTYLSSRIKHMTGHSYSHIIRNLRMEHAGELLKTTNMKLEEICDSIGYTDVTQFIKTFKKFYGTTPNKYRKQKSE